MAVWDGFLPGGAEGIRTPDLLSAICARASRCVLWNLATSLLDGLSMGHRSRSCSEGVPKTATTAVKLMSVLHAHCRFGRQDQTDEYPFEAGRPTVSEVRRQHYPGLERD